MGFTVCYRIWNSKGISAWADIYTEVWSCAFGYDEPVSWYQVRQ